MDIAGVFFLRKYEVRVRNPDKIDHGESVMKEALKLQPNRTIPDKVLASAIDRVYCRHGWQKHVKPI
jgi:hypothetical protein